MILKVFVRMIVKMIRRFMVMWAFFFVLLSTLNCFSVSWRSMCSECMLATLLPLLPLLPFSVVVVLLSKLVSSSWCLLGNDLVLGELCFTGQRDWNLVDDLDGMGGGRS